ncbi:MULTISPECIES: toxin glutamine deamidase domain-containing protein [Flavobacterium]|uniref:Tox-PL domain-containing protein n=1 Tax=Flavobacterium hankyongi TaxID=1176532 RepID=A0ABP8ZNN6_9FLAO|nr:toxin glutamine deamidase domain-containing protein [Flavobacterium sp. N1846]
MDEVIEGGANKKLLSIWNVNAKKGKLNCANCAIAVDLTLAGKPTSALPWTYKKVMKNGKLVDKISYDVGTNYTFLEDFYKSKFTKAMSVSDIKTFMKPNQRAIVFAYNKNSKIGHYFNVYNENGVVKFLDGQIGKKAILDYDVYHILLTNF